MSTQPIRFFYQGALRTVSAAPITRTVLQYLREDLRRTGTKEGCAEGDCGACTVALGELTANGRLALKTVNACIQLLPTLDGRALFSIEDLADPIHNTLHPAQQALVDCHGSQCGFCTPGFTMSMWTLYQNHDVATGPPARSVIDDTLSGNLCRCTGYRPIIDATRRMFDAREYPRATLDTAPVVAALQSIARTATFRYRADNAAGDGGATFAAPLTLDAFATLRAQHPAAIVLGGGTDIGLWVTKQFRALPHLLYTGNVADLQRIDRDSTTLTLGSAVSLQRAYAALAADHPALTDLWRRFASLPVRNAGTLGGNLANGSPIGDSMPVLLALGARVRLRRGTQSRTLALDDFYLGYQRNALQPGEFIEAICVPRPDPAQPRLLRTYKVSKRRDQDISAVCAAFALRLTQGDQPVVVEARIAFGGMAAMPRRAALAEAELTGQPWHEASARRAMAALAQDFQPLSDMRASAAYRAKVARNLVWRFLLETRDTAPLTATEVNVFALAAALADAGAAP